MIHVKTSSWQHCQGQGELLSQGSAEPQLGLSHPALAGTQVALLLLFSLPSLGTCPSCPALVPAPHKLERKAIGVLLFRKDADLYETWVGI